MIHDGERTLKSFSIKISDRSRRRADRPASQGAARAASCVPDASGLNRSHECVVILPSDAAAALFNPKISGGASVVDQGEVTVSKDITAISRVGTTKPTDCKSASWRATTASKSSRSGSISA